MSSISSFNSSSTNLYQLFSNLASSSAAGGSASASASGSASASDEILALLASQQIDGAEPDSDDSSTTDGSNTAGSTNSTNSTSSTNSSSGSNVSLSSLRQQIETAVTDAIDNLSSSQLADPGATAQAVKQAVSQTLQQNGIDPTQLSATYSSDPTSSSDTMPTSFGGAAGAAGQSGATGGSSGGSSTNSTGSASGGTSSSATGSLLNQLLSANDIDPTDFQNNLLSAISGAQNGQVDLSQLFQNFPSGQDIDAVA